MFLAVTVYYERPLLFHQFCSFFVFLCFPLFCSHLRALVYQDGRCCRYYTYGIVDKCFQKTKRQVEVPDPFSYTQQLQKVFLSTATICLLDVHEARDAEEMYHSSSSERKTSKSYSQIEVFKKRL